MRRAIFLALTVLVGCRIEGGEGPSPCHDSAYNVDDLDASHVCDPSAVGDLRNMNGRAYWVCTCPRDAGAREVER